MKIRKAFKSDIPFIVNAILEIEKTENLNTYSNLFSVDNQTAFNYLEQIFLDDENLHTELSLNTFSVAEIDGILAGCCSHIFTDQEYYLNKSEIFPVHLNNPDLQNFMKNALTLPNQKSASEKKHFVEYIFVSEKYRRMGIAEKMINYQMEIISANIIYINVMSNNNVAVKYYKKLGFKEDCKVTIDTLENKIFPCAEKIILFKTI